MNAQNLINLIQENSQAIVVNIKNLGTEQLDSKHWHVVALDFVNVQLLTVAELVDNLEAAQLDFTCDGFSLGKKVAELPDNQKLIVIWSF